MFHHLYQDLPAPKSSSNNNNTTKEQQFAVQVTEQAETKAPCSEEQQVKKETVTATRWSTAAARLLQPPPSVLVKRTTAQVSKPLKERVTGKRPQDEKPANVEEDNETVKESVEEEVSTSQETATTWQVAEEYDPLRPNDFETCLREREWNKAQQIKSSFG